MNVIVETGNGPEAELKSRKRIGRIGAELVVKAAICAAMIALIAVVAAAFFGS